MRLTNIKKIVLVALSCKKYYFFIIQAKHFFKYYFNNLLNRTAFIVSSPRFNVLYRTVTPSSVINYKLIVTQMFDIS